MAETQTKSLLEFYKEFNEQTRFNTPHSNKRVEARVERIAKLYKAALPFVSEFDIEQMKREARAFFEKKPDRQKVNQLVKMMKELALRSPEQKMLFWLGNDILNKAKQIHVMKNRHKFNVREMMELYETQKSAQQK